MTTEAQNSSSQENTPDPKPVIEIHFEKFIPNQYQLDRYVDIIHSNSNFLQILKKHPDTKITPENINQNSVPDDELDDLDQEIEELLKQMEREERKARDSLYV
ncbi:MAG: hypothetical protein ACTSYI_11925 [Promethearchaeota archaeon]